MNWVLPLILALFGVRARAPFAHGDATEPEPLDFDDSEVTICGGCHERVTRCVCPPEAS
jgi:cytochrome c553